MEPRVSRCGLWQAHTRRRCLWAAGVSPPAARCWLILKNVPSTSCLSTTCERHRPSGRHRHGQRRRTVLVESYANVHHLVSQVSGILPDGVPVTAALKSAFCPIATLTGRRRFGRWRSRRLEPTAESSAAPWSPSAATARATRRWRFAASRPAASGIEMGVGAAS